MVKRVEHIWIKGDNNLSNLCHISKNLYNEANYIIRQELFNSGRWIRYNELYHLLKNSDNYKSLPAQTSQQILKLLDKSWKSFFRAMKEWKKHPEKFLERPRLPRYKDKNGEHILVFTNQQAKIRDGKLILPKMVDLEVKTRVDRLREVRILPKGVGYLIEIVYEKIINPKRRDKKHVAGIDLGVRNLITMVNNIGEKPIVVKGGVVKSINQYFNKEMAKLQSIYAKQKIRTGKKAKRLSVKRERKINDVFHKISRAVVNWCIVHDIGIIVIGYNQNWKQRVKISRVNNQNFVQIPFYKLINQITYKAEEEGIRVILQDESHTSKCSFLDEEPVEHREHYVGKRKSRGLFRSARGIIINADVNGACNTVRKAIPNAFQKWSADGIEGVGLHPVRWKFNIIAQGGLEHVF
ncbi:MAG: transposase [Spirochaetes bacterium]|nr:MAG: transposase [Spirochaetota bacterium]